MYTGMIVYNKDFAIYESEYLAYSFHNCYDVSNCSRYEDSFLDILRRLKEDCCLNSEEYLQWVSCFLEDLIKNKVFLNTRILHFVIDLSRLNAWVESLYQKYKLDKYIIDDIAYLNYTPNKFNDYMIRYYYYCSLLNKYASLGKQDKDILLQEKDIELRNSLCDWLTLHRVAADLKLSI